MKLSYKILIISLVLLALTVGAVSAAENASDVQTTVDSDASAVSPDDVAVESIESNDNDVISRDVSNENKLGTTHNFTGTTFSELQTKIDEVQSGDIIVLQNDVLSMGSKQIKLNKSITIEGNGHNICGENSYIFRASDKSGNLVFNNIIFKNFSDAIFANKNFNTFISNCFFINGSGNNVYIYGGFVVNCTFLNYRSSKSILRIESNSKVVNCSFINGTIFDSSYTYGIDVWGFNNIISNCRFINNSGKYNSYLLYCHDGNNTISNLIFENNTDVGYLITLSVYNGKQYDKCIFVDNCTFTNNNVIRTLFDGDTQQRGKLYLSNSNFKNNTYGSLLICTLRDSVIFNCTIADSFSSSNGGLLLLRINCNISNCSFINNNGAKGILDDVVPENVNIYGCHFINNSATVGGAAIHYTRAHSTKNLNISDCYFINNTAPKGGAIYSESNIGNISNSIFENNGMSEIMVGNNWTFNNIKLTYNHVNIIILNNSTSSANYNQATSITAIIKDDNNNTLIPPNTGFYYILPNGTNIAAKVNTNTGVWSASYAFTEVGICPITAVLKGFDNQTVYGGSVDVKIGEFGLLQQLINEAPVGGVINLTRDYTFDPKYDAPAGITINKNLTINGNGHSLNAEETDIFTISKANVIINNINFVKGYSPIQMTDSNVTVSNSKFMSTTGLYDIYTIRGSLYLNNNTIGKLIYISSTKILSKTTISVLNNSTINAGVNKSKQVFAFIYDDNNNKIIGSSLITFALNNGNTFTASSYSSSYGYVYGTYTFKQIGSFQVSVKSNSYLINTTVYNGTVEVKMGEFALLQKLINDAEVGSVITLDRDYICNPDLDSRININKNLSINGNGHILDGAGKIAVFYISSTVNVVLNNINFKNANSYGVEKYSANLNITNCNFINTLGSYDIYSSGGSLYLNNNTVSKKIYISNTKLLSKVKISVLNNSTSYACVNNSKQVSAFIYDDNDNKIIGYNLITFVLNNATTFSSGYSSSYDYIYGSYTFTQTGIYHVSARPSNYLTNIFAIYNGTVKVNVTQFYLLQEIINNAHDGDVINLTQDYTYDLLYDSCRNILIENKQLTINGNGHVIDAKGSARVFNIKGSNLVISNITFKNANQYAIVFNSPNTSNTTITNCNFINSTSYDIHSISAYSLFLEKNNCPKGIYTGKYVLSNVNIIILNNSTEYNAKDSIAKITAIITDDNNNFIVGEELYLVLENGTEISATYDQITEVYSAEYVFSQYGDYLISANYSKLYLPNVVIYKGIVAIREITTLNISDLGNITKGNTTVEIKVPENLTGNITVTVDGKNYTAPIENGTAKIDLSNLTVGNHNATITYGGDDINSPATTNTTITIDKKPTSPSDINITDEGNATVANATFDVTVPKDYTGNITVTVDGKNYTAPIENGTARVNLTGVEPGSHNATVTYSGDENNEPTTKNTIIKIGKIPTPSSDINVTNAVNLTSGNATLIVMVPKDHTGNITVNIAGKNYTAPIANGTANVDLNSVKPGSYNATVYYSGDKKHDLGKTNILIKIPEPVITLIGNDVTALYSATAVYKVLVLSDGKNITNGENVTITYNGVKYVVKTLNGYATLTLKTAVKVGTYTVTVSYANKTISNKVVIKNIINAKKLKKLKKSKKVNKVKVSLAKVNGKYLKGKKLTLKLKGKKVASAKTNKKGVATFKVKKKKLKKFKKGKKVKATVSFGKDVVTKKIKIV